MRIYLGIQYKRGKLVSSFVLGLFIGGSAFKAKKLIQLNNYIIIIIIIHLFGYKAYSNDYDQ